MSSHKRKRKKIATRKSKLKKAKVRKKRKQKGKRDSKHNQFREKSKCAKKNTQHKPLTNKVTVKTIRLPCKRYEEFHDHFLDYGQIVTFLEKTSKNHPEMVNLSIIGHSGQGKPIYMTIITTDTLSTSPKLATFIEAGLKGDDIFAVSNALYIIDYLSKNPNYIKIMDYFIVPCGNPDAYDQFVKSKVTEKKQCGVKRSRSNNSNVGEKKPCLENSKKEKQEAKNNPLCYYSSLGDSKDTGTSNVKCSPENERSTCLSKNGETSKKDPCKPSSKQPVQKSLTDNSKNNCKKPKTNSQTNENHEESSFRMDLSLNFPVVLGLNDMRRIPTDIFLERIKVWKENYVNTSPETLALVNTINNYQFAIKLLISLQEGGETISYPYGFCTAIHEDTNELKTIAKKGKSAINERAFQFGTTHNVQGLTYGNLIDFLTTDKGSIKYTYIIQVHKKTPTYNEIQERKHLMKYGCEIMECIKRMSTAVFKCYTNMTGNKTVETERTKLGLDKKSSF